MTTYTQSPNESRPAFLRRIFADKWFTLDGDMLFSMPEFITMNEVETGDAISMATMPVDSTMVIGGGAFASYTLKRTR
jgi:hypothetical protein